MFKQNGGVRPAAKAQMIDIKEPHYQTCHIEFENTDLIQNDKYNESYAGLVKGGTFQRSDEDIKNPKIKKSVINSVGRIDKYTSHF